ncbi:hypothetical protein SAMN05192529_10923 [Arachidicoccus rhizosphaerae]|uniref:Uncharacterized protein n=1 Tax=Arachidicoccus rhizosphaerae TaxID=551991 RepID=A0A1H3YTR1_9BACT|nr:hypothetical protein SAMN05192529_10923 [Arachidicoccus rhizosphaerae]
MEEVRYLDRVIAYIVGFSWDKSNGQSYLDSYLLAGWSFLVMLGEISANSIYIIFSW